MSTITERLNTTTNTKLLPKLVDTVLGGNVFAQKMLANAKLWTGGKKLTKAIKFQNGTSGQSFEGFDTFATNASNRRVNLEFAPKGYEKSVALPFQEIDINENTEGEVINLAASEVAMAAQEMADEIGTIFYSDGTGNSSKDFLGLLAIVDDSTNAATYGGLARATYTTLNATYTNCSSTLTLAKMATLYNAVTSGIHKPTIGLTTETVFSLVEQLVQPFERINTNAIRAQGLTASVGFTGIEYKGFLITSDEKCSSGRMYFLNENFIDWNAIKPKMQKAIDYDPSEIEGNNYSSEVKGLGFSSSGWLRAYNGYSGVNHIILQGELQSWDPGKHGQLHTITTV
jgi:hypothetical protein